MPKASTLLASPGKNLQETWRDRLRTFASKPPEEMGDDWGLFLRQLGLTNGYYLAVYEVLKQGRWEAAPYPRAHVKKAATIEARKMHLSIPHKDDSFECRDSHLEFAGGIGDFDRNTNELQFKDYLRYEAETEARDIEESKPEFPAELMSLQEPRWWEMVAIEGGPPLAYRTLDGWFRGPKGPRIQLQKDVLQFDWEKWTQRAGLDSWENKVALYRRDGLSRECALAQQPDEQSRKALQAAWRRFDRTGMKKLRECVRKMQEICPG